MSTKYPRIDPKRLGVSESGVMLSNRTGKGEYVSWDEARQGRGGKGSKGKGSCG